jgi:hypothetical protein
VQPETAEAAGASGSAQFSLGDDETLKLEPAEGGSGQVAGNPLTVSWALTNSGGAPGSPVVSFLVDGSLHEEMQFSVEFAPGESLPQDYCVMQVQPLDAGSHLVALTVSPGHPGADRIERTIEVTDHA